MVAIVFPGQGSQAPGMGKFLFENFKVAKECFEEASDVLSLDLKKLCFEGSEQELGLTENTQPALLLVSTAMFRSAQEELGLSASYYAGHSVGEYAALVAAKTMEFSDAIRAVRKRGQSMQSAVPVGEGGMLAVMGPTPEEVRDVCAWAEKESGTSPISPANYNSPGQIVVSGKKATVDWLHANMSQFEFPSQPRRLRTIPLKVSAPFHCAMMKPAEEEMAKVLLDIQFQNAEVPVVQNFVAKAVSEASELRENLTRQITGPVRWIESVEEMQKLGVEKAFECGTGKVLSGLIKKITPEMGTMSAGNLEEFQALEGQFS